MSSADHPPLPLRRRGSYVSKQINMDEPLSPEDRRYLIERDRMAEVRANEEKFGKRSGTTGAERRERIEQLRNELAELEAAEAQDANANVADVQPNAQFPHTQGVPPPHGPVDNTPVDGEVPTGARSADEDNYENMSKPELEKELSKRNTDRERVGDEPLNTRGTKAELIDRLRQDDQELAAQEQ